MNITSSNKELYKSGLLLLLKQRGVCTGIDCDNCIIDNCIIHDSCRGIDMNSSGGTMLAKKIRPLAEREALILIISQEGSCSIPKSVSCSACGLSSKCPIAPLKNINQEKKKLAIELYIEKYGRRALLDDLVEYKI